MFFHIHDTARGHAIFLAKSSASAAFLHLKAVVLTGISSEDSNLVTLASPGWYLS